MVCRRSIECERLWLCPTPGEGRRCGRGIDGMESVHIYRYLRSDRSGARNVMDWSESVVE